MGLGTEPIEADPSAAGGVPNEVVAGLVERFSAWGTADSVTISRNSGHLEGRALRLRTKASSPK